MPMRAVTWHIIGYHSCGFLYRIFCVSLCDGRLGLWSRKTWLMMMERVMAPPPLT